MEKEEKDVLEKLDSTTPDFKVYETEIFDLLMNQNKINKVSFYESTFKTNLDGFLPVVIQKNDDDYFVEASSYLCGKAIEMVIIQKIRPEVDRVWLSPEEVTGSIVTNLPEHLHLMVLDVMNGCENALNRYMEEVNIDMKDILMKIQYIGEMICNKHRLYDILVDGYTNSELGIPQEMFNFTNGIVLKELELEGYKVLGYTKNFNSAVSFVLEKDGEKRFVLENVVVSPKVSRFQPYLRHQLIDIAKKEGGVAYCLGVQIESKDEDVKSKGLFVKKGQYSIKRTDFIKA